jgi:hypothetical protein
MRANSVLTATVVVVGSFAGVVIVHFCDPRSTMAAGCFVSFVMWQTARVLFSGRR